MGQLRVRTWLIVKQHVLLNAKQVILVWGSPSFSTGGPTRARDIDHVFGSPLLPLYKNFVYEPLGDPQPIVFSQLLVAPVQYKQTWDTTQLLVMHFVVFRQDALLHSPFPLKVDMLHPQDALLSRMGVALPQIPYQPCILHLEQRLHPHRHQSQLLQVGPQLQLRQPSLPYHRQQFQPHWPLRNLLLGLQLLKVHRQAQQQRYHRIPLPSLPHKTPRSTPRIAHRLPRRTLRPKVRRVSRPRARPILRRVARPKVRYPRHQTRQTIPPIHRRNNRRNTRRDYPPPQHLNHKPSSLDYQENRK